MKSKKIDLESSIEKLESEVRLYHDLDAVVKSYQDKGELSDKDITSVLERIKFQIILDAVHRQSGIKDKLDRISKKWNLFSRPDKPLAALKGEPESEPEPEIESPGEEIAEGKSEKGLKRIFRRKEKKKDSDKVFNKLKRKIKINRCENCGYFLVNDADQGIYQCTFFEFSSKVDKKDVCENWTDIKKHKKSFF